MALPDNIQSCLQEFLNDRNCKLNQTARSRRSIFSASEHDSLRRITKIFERNFQNILLHERARKFQLETMNQKINAEEAGLGEFRNYLKSTQLIENLHRLQNDFYLLFVENLNILESDLRNSDLVRIMKLFRYKQCEFLNLMNACVYLDNFRVEKNVIHANFQHNAPRIMNFTMFSCRVVEFEGNYLINGLHNQVVGPTDIHRYNKTRPVQASDFVLKNLEVIATREIIDEEECYTLFCLANLSFYQNSTLIYCNKGKTKVFCGEFKVTFDEGVVSHMKLRSHFSRVDFAGPITELFNEQIPSGLSEQNFPTEHDNNEQLEIETDNATVREIYN